MTTKLQKKSKLRFLKSFFKVFIRIDRIPFDENGHSLEYYTIYIFGLAVFSSINHKNSKKCL